MNNHQPLKTPQMRICVTPYCNLHCIYCTPEGEGYEGNLDERMTKDEIVKLIEISSDLGICNIKFTGGEPLMRNDIVEIISTAVRVNGIKDIQMVTNGTLLLQKVENLKQSGLSSLTISLDAVDSNTFNEIRGGNVQTIISALYECRRVGLPVRINTVIIRKNVDQIPYLIELAETTGASLKLLDLMDLQRRRGDFDLWHNEFYPFNLLKMNLEKMGAQFVGLEEAPGGIGAPLLDYRFPNGIQVVLKDSLEGTCYASYCLPCPSYPCQDALISLRITHDGHLKVCLLRNDNLINVLEPLRKKDFTTVRSQMAESLKILCNSEFYPRMWKPRDTDLRSDDRIS